MWLLPDSTYVELSLENVDIYINFHINKAPNNFIRINLYEIGIDFGQSYFHHENWLVGLFLNELAKYVIVMIENTAWLAGPVVFNPIINTALANELN